MKSIFDTFAENLLSHCSCLMRNQGSICKSFSLNYQENAKESCYDGCTTFEGVRILSYRYPSYLVKIYSVPSCLIVFNILIVFIYKTLMQYNGPGKPVSPFADNTMVFVWYYRLGLWFTTSHQHYTTITQRTCGHEFAITGTKYWSLYFTFIKI